MKQESPSSPPGVSVLGFTLALFSVVATSHASDIYPISSLDISKIEQGWGQPRANHSVDQHALTIGGQVFTNGLGTHAASEFVLDLNGAGESFSATVGVDDEVARGQGRVVFKLMGDGKTLWQSSEMHGGDAARQAEVNLAGVKMFSLVVDAAGDSIDFDHADWADAKITMREGKPVPAVSPPEVAEVLTPEAPPTPRINSSKAFGVRPGAPFLYTIAATGVRPMKFSASGLPNGLKLDSTTGQITGTLSKTGEYKVTLQAKNAKGTARKRPLKIICGSTIGLVPALGWNSWNCFASAVTAEKVKSAADAMVASGLINHGWTYINIDDYWEVNRNSRDPSLQGPRRDTNGFIIPNPRFPDMKGLADYVHAKGLRIGLYPGPGPWTCGGCVASYQHEALDAQSYAQWGFDYLKYDWCSYGDIDNGRTLAGLEKPYQVMRAALDKQNRDILFSFCQYGMGKVWEWGESIGGNSWRITGDINDSWSSMANIGFGQAGHEKFAGPGHFNDPDMLVVGKVGWGPQLHSTKLKPNEQYTHISLWCLLSAPLLIGCDMTQLDPFTLNLLSNDEVLEVNQDPLGQQAARVAKDGDFEVWAKQMEDGSKAVGLFNRSASEAQVTAKWSDLGLTGKQKVRDLWRQKDYGKFSGSFTASIPRHGVVLVRISPGK